MAVYQLVPPTFITVYEAQSFTYNLTFYDGTSAITGISGITSAQYAFATNSSQVTTWLNFPSTVSASLVTASLYQDVKLQGTWPQLFFDSEWISRPSVASTSTVTTSSYETVVRPYFSAQRYRGDVNTETTVLIRIQANYGTPAIPVTGTFYATQRIRNSYNKKRNQVIPFVQGGSSDVATFRFPGGSLGGFVGQDIPEPGAETGLDKFPITVTLTEGSGTITVAATVSNITVKLNGGGGAGGAGYVSTQWSASGGGGGGGGYIESIIPVREGQVIAYSVGVGGDINSDNLGRGGDTYFSSITASGGSKGGDGFISASYPVALGGAAGGPVGNAGGRGSVGRPDSAGNIADQTGGAGGDAFNPNTGQGGDGGNKLLPTGATGQSGTGYGAGGGGGGTQRGTQGPWYGAPGTGGLIEFSYTGQRFIFTDIIAANTLNYNVRTAAVAQGWDGFVPLKATITIQAGVTVYSDDVNLPAFSSGNLPNYSEVNITNNGTIMGRGGDGGGALAFNIRVLPTGGGSGIYTNQNIFITNNGTILGGGGGGCCALGGAQNYGAGGTGGGGAGGGWGGPLVTPSGTGTRGQGGGLGAAGTNGGFAQVGPYGSPRAPGSRNGLGGGGGRIIPGVGGAAGIGGTSPGGGGGGAGGGGAGGAISFPDGSGSISVTAFNGGPGGSGANEGGAGPSSGGGGGGWGAAGASYLPAGASVIGGVGGKAVETNGKQVVFSSVGTIYGLVSGSAAGVGYQVMVTSNQINFNVRNFMVNSGWNQSTTAVVVVPVPVYLYSETVGNAAVIVDGSFPNGCTIYNYGAIIGKGGKGATVTATGTNIAPENGGPAIQASVPLKIYNNYYIAGGGGGGGGKGCGGGGAGGGAGGDGSTNAIPKPGGVGGAPGQNGGDGEDTGAVLEGGNGGGAGGAGGGAFRQATPAGVVDAYAPGGGGGRILPGAGAAANSAANNGTGGAGGSANQAGLNGGTPVLGQGGGGGGGWGAAGGSTTGPGSTTGFGVNVPGTGGKAINTSGNTITYLRVGNIWGAVG